MTLRSASSNRLNILSITSSTLIETEQFMARLCWDLFLNHGDRAIFSPFLSIFIFEASQKVPIADSAEG